MSPMESFHFIRPLWLLMIPLATAIWFAHRKLQDPLRGWRAVIAPDLLAELTVGSDSGNRWRDTGLLVAWVLASIAIAGPTWRPEPSPFGDDPVPVMLVLRAGESMNQSDLMPNRMERAQLKAVNFANRRSGQPTGLCVYSGSAHLVLPPTRDTEVVASMAVEITPEIMPKTGDGLAAALTIAEQTLGEEGGSIVVIADRVDPGSITALKQFRSDTRRPVFLLAVARGDTPELDSIQEAASAIGASFTSLTPESDDVDWLIRKTAKAPVAIGEAGEGQRWAESGWWLVPVIVLISLVGFRRVQSEEMGSPES